MTYVMGRTARDRHDQALRSLHPAFGTRVEEVVRHLGNKGWHAYVFQGKNRPKAEAQENARKGVGIEFSWHRPDVSGSIGFQLVQLYAADIVDERWHWEGPCSDTEHPFWRDVGHFAKIQGLEWGGDWDKKDVAHVQMMIIDSPRSTSAIV